MARRRSIQAWLQERQYSTPYHWHQRGNNEIEYQLRTRIVLELASLNNGKRPRLLDIGCGDGRFLADASFHAKAIGLDISRRALGHARRLVPAAGLISGAGEALPFPDATFDVVTLLDVIEHIPDSDERRATAEAHRVLRHGGGLVVSTNTDRSARELKHFRHYSIPQFMDLFDRFTDVRLVGLVPYLPTLRYWIAAPFVGRLLRSRVRTCAPEHAQTVIGIGLKR